MRPLGRISPSLRAKLAVRPPLRSPVQRVLLSTAKPAAPAAPKKRSKLIIGLLAGGAGFSLLYLTNDSFAQTVRHTKLAIGRIATVVVACTRCIRHYEKVLNAEYSSQEEHDKALSACHKKCAEITRKALERNAGVFIKLGQHISALTYIFPDEWTSAMIPLQDKCPVSSIESIREMFLNDTGKPLEEFFDHFEPVPLGTASLAQVHKAVLKGTSQEVAVKVQHPSLQEFVPLDVLMTRVVFNLVDFFFKDYPLTWLSDELQESIFVELDFREEGKNARRTQEYFKDFYNETALRVPDVFWAQKRILVMEFIRGARPDDLVYLDNHNISRNELSCCMSHIFNNMIFTPGVGLHCDPHPGNIAIIPKKGGKHNFEIILYDHGLYRDVPTDIRRSYAHFWLALIDNNEEEMKYYANKFAGISDENFKLFSAAITGRDFDNTTNIASRRSRDEITQMNSTVADSEILSEIMMLLHSMPRIILLILKTNDLTRLIDERLQNPLGPERTFLIMATYCARTVYDEGRERISRLYKSQWSIRRWAAEFANWWQFFRRESQLTLYDIGMLFKGIFAS
ncbi:ABC1 family protein Mcp2p [Trichomonascus vanleenenianus]|uniref:Cqd2p n=1 Tax=Trichomonascus vanleenenianus TaxID=2268995 RepID=UPI003ECAA015